MPKAEKKRTEDIDKKNLAEDLRKLQKSHKNSSLPELGVMVQSTLEACAAELFEEEERKKKERERRKQALAYEYIVICKKLQEMEEYAARHPHDPFANDASDLAKKYLPDMLKKMSDSENKAAEQKVFDMELKEENDMMKTFQAELKGAPEPEPAKPEAKNAEPEKEQPQQIQPNKPKKSFAERKAETADTIAKMLALQILSNNVKSLIVGMDDMADAGAGERLTEQEIQKIKEDMLTMENVNANYEMIKGRDDFNKMMDGIKTENDLETLKNKALDGSGKQIQHELFKAGRKLIDEDMKKEQAAKQLAQANINKEMIPDGPVLKPDNDFLNN